MKPQQQPIVKPNCHETVKGLVKGSARVATVATEMWQNPNDLWKVMSSQLHKASFWWFIVRLTHNDTVFM